MSSARSILTRTVLPACDWLEMARSPQVGDAAAAAEEAIGEDIVYEIYTPKYISEGVKHPDPVVETASLAGVSSPHVCIKFFVDLSRRNAELPSALQASQHKNLHNNCTDQWMSELKGCGAPASACL